VTVCHVGDDESRREHRAIERLGATLHGSPRTASVWLRALPRARNTGPVVILNARGGSTKGRGLTRRRRRPPEAVSVEETRARPRGVGAASQGGDEHCSIRGPRLNLTTREVRRAGKKIELNCAEFRVMRILMRTTGRVHTRTQALRARVGFIIRSRTNLVAVGISAPPKNRRRPRRAARGRRARRRYT